MVDTPFTTFAFKSTTGSANRTMPHRLDDVFNVKDYGAAGDNSNDDTTAINAAIAAAAAAGGGLNFGATVFFPPGSYLITDSIKCLVAQAGIRLLGSGYNNTAIFCNMAGKFAIDQNAVDRAITAIEHIWVQNSSVPATNARDITVGCIRFNNVQGGFVNQVFMNGYTCFLADTNTFETLVQACHATGRAVNGDGMSGSIGYAVVGCALVSCTALGFNVGYQIFDLENSVFRCRCESSNYGFLLGLNDTGGVTPASNLALMGSTCERVNYPIYVVSAGSALIGATVVGYNIGRIMSSITNMTTGNGTTCTVTLADPLAWFTKDDGVTAWSSGTKTVVIQDCGNAAYNTASFVTATRTGANTFTYPTSATSAQGAFGDVSPPMYAGLTIIDARNITVTGFNAAFGDLFGNATQNPLIASFDLSQLYSIFTAVSLAPSASTGTVTFLNCGDVGNNIGGWAMPSSAKAHVSGQLCKGMLRFIGCNQPTGSTTDRLGNVAGMSFADLPGKTNTVNIAVEGMQFDIVDCNVSAFLGTAAGGGSTTTAHRLVRYNAVSAAWQVIG